MKSVCRPDPFAVSHRGLSSKLVSNPQLLYIQGQWGSYIVVKYTKDCPINYCSKQSQGNQSQSLDLYFEDIFSLSDITVFGDISVWVTFQFW